MAQYHFPLSLLFCLCRHLTLSILPGGRSELQGMAEDSSETSHLTLPIQTMFPFALRLKMRFTVVSKVVLNFIVQIQLFLDDMTLTYKYLRAKHCLQDMLLK